MSFMAEVYVRLERAELIKDFLSESDEEIQDEIIKKFERTTSTLTFLKDLRENETDYTLVDLLHEASEKMEKCLVKLDTEGVNAALAECTEVMTMIKLSKGITC